MAYTPEQIASLPISDPILKAKFAASQGVPLALAADPSASAAPASAPAFFTPAPIITPAPEATYTPGMASPYSSVDGGPAPASNAMPPPPPANAPPAEKQAYYLRMKGMYGATPDEAQAALMSSAPVTPAASGGVPMSAAPPTAPMGPPSPPAGMMQPKPPASSGGGGYGSGPALPLQPPAPPPEGLYHGMDPLHVGTPGQQKLAVIEGQQLYGQGEYAKQGAAVDAGLAGDYDQQAQAIAADADKRAADAERKAAERKAFLAKYNADTERQINDYAKAEIKPDRLWAGEAGTANAVSAVIGAFASGIAGYLDPSKDYVGQFANRIEQKIAQDIEVQKANIAKRGAGIEARRGLYGSYLQQFGQEDAAEAAAYETYLRKTKAQVDSYASKATSEKAKIQLGAMSAALDDRMRIWSATRQASGEAMIDQYQAQQAKAQQAAAAAAYARDKADDDANLAILKAKGGELGGVGITRLPPGTKLPNGMVVNNKLGMPVLIDANGNIVDTGTITAKAKAEGGGSNAVTTIAGFNEQGDPIYGQGTLVGKDPKAFNEAQQAYTSIKQDIKTIKDLRAKHGGGALWSPDDEAKANAAASRVQLALKSPAFFQLGVIAGPDKDYLISQMPDKPLEMKAAGIVGSDPIGVQLNGVESYLDGKYKNAEATYVKGGAQKNSALPLTAPVKPVGK